MSDPLSVISAVVGILAAAGKVIEVLGPYVSAAKDTPKIARSVHCEILNSRIILSALHGLLENLETASNNRKLLVPIDNLIAVFTNGVLIFSELEQAVLKISLSGSDRLTARMQWARKEGDFAAILIRLQAFKDTTLLLLNILQCDSDRRAAQTQDELSAKLLELLGNSDISQRLKTLEDSFCALSLVEPQKSRQSQSTVSTFSEHTSDVDNSSFYSVKTTKPISGDPRLGSASIHSDPSFTIPAFKFQTALDESVPYRRARVGTMALATVSSLATSNASSVFSGVSLSEVSVLSRVAIPVFPSDISNAHHYEFMKSSTAKLYTARRPTEATMGQWAQSVRRTSLLKELRFDIQFEVPVLFLCPPSAGNAPLRGQPIRFIDGSDKSLGQTWSELPYAPSGVTKKIDRKGLWAAARNPFSELASWVTLLSALQQMESESRAWQRHTLEANRSNSNSSGNGTLTAEPGIDGILLGVSQRYTLAVAIQRKSTKWAELPLNFQRPLATTTWFHAIELAAILGIYWKSFNRSQDIYQAHENGLTVTSDSIPDVGIVLTFKVHGRSRFDSNRVIPKEEVQELCFGFIPTIFRPYEDVLRHRKLPRNNQPTAGTLHFASAGEIAQSLVSIGCNSFTANVFLEGKVDSHIFPIVFEIIGMVARSVHIQSSAFRMLPNPTQYRWDTAGFSLYRLLKAFIHQLEESLNANPRRNKFEHPVILRHGRAILSHMDESRRDSPHYDIIDSLHEIINETTEFLTADSSRRYPIPNNSAVFPSFGRIDQPDKSDWNYKLNKDSKKSQIRRRKLALLILRNHVQLVLAGLNGETEFETQLETEPISDTTAPLAWKQLNRQSTEFKESTLMGIYFKIFRPKVVADVEKLADALDVPSGEERISDLKKGDLRLGNVPQWEKMEVSCEDLWCMMVFRSICWLMLHDFHPDDTQIPKSDLFWSHLKVYIA